MKVDDIMYEKITALWCDLNHDSEVVLLGRNAYYNREIVVLREKNQRLEMVPNADGMITLRRKKEKKEL